MTEVKHFALKEDFTCPCAEAKCPKDGQPSQHKMTDGSRHIRKCPCISCRNRKNRTKGLTNGQVKVARILGAPGTSVLRPGDEETLRTVLRFESKEGAQCRGVHTFFDNCSDQSAAKKSIGDRRPFVASATLDDRGIILIDGETMPEVVAWMGAYYGYWDS